MKIKHWIAGLFGVIPLVLFAVAASGIYNPTTGTWMQRDTLDYVDGLSLYQYVGGNPIVKTDPTGSCAEGSRLTTVQVNGKTFHVGVPRLVKLDSNVTDWGGYSYNVDYQPRPANTRGVVVQKFTATGHVTYCGGSKKGQDAMRATTRAIVDKSPFYEAFLYKNGHLVNNNDNAVSDKWHSASYPSGACTEGKIHIASEIKAATDQGIPSGYNTDMWPQGLRFTETGDIDHGPIVGSDPVSKNPPTWWNAAPTGAERSMTVEWDECAGKKTKIETNP